MSRLWSTSNDLCNADSYLVESLADFIFVFSLFRSSHPMVFLEKGVLEICGKFTGEHPCWSVISIKLLCNLAASACSLACESFYGWWEACILLDKAICSEFNVLLFSIIIETKELFGSGTRYHSSCCNIIKLSVII